MRCSTPMSSASAKVREEVGLTTIEGRPARPWPTGTDSQTSPALTRSVVIARTVLRFNPVRVVNPARDMGPRTCSSRSRRPTLWRRISSWVAATASFMVGGGPVLHPSCGSGATAGDGIDAGRYEQDDSGDHEDHT